MKTIFSRLIAIIALAAFTTCSTAQRITFPTDINNYAAELNFEVMNEYLQFQKEMDKHSVYNAKNNIGYLMDLGFIEHYAGNYQESSKYLLEAERLIWEAYTKSISDGFKSFATVNPYKVEYPGEDFENIYINIFCALNFLHMGDLEKALVEVRRVNEKLLYMNDEYEKNFNSLSIETRSKASKIEYYTNSALVRYLCVLLWRAIGNMDSARIDAIGLNEAFAAAPHLYTHPVPPEMVMRGDICDETSIPAGMARLNFLSFTGFSPHKIPLDTSDFDDGTGYEPNIKSLSYRRSPVDRIEVIFDNGRRLNLSLLEPLDVISQQIFETKEAYRRSAWGAHTVGSFFTDALLIALTLGIYGGKSEATRNTALDMRMSQLLPGKAYVGGINLPPGTYSFTLNYYSGQKIIERRRIENKAVSAGGLNLVHDYSLKFEETRMPNKWNYESIAAMPDFPGRLQPPSNFRYKADEPEPEGLRTIDLTSVRWDPVPGAVAYYIYLVNPVSSSREYVVKGVVTEPRLLTGGFTSGSGRRIIAVGAGGFSVPSGSF